MGDRPDDDAPVMRSTSGRSVRPPGRAIIAVALVLTVLGLLASLAGVGASILIDDWRWDEWVTGAVAVVFAAVAVSLAALLRTLHRASSTPRHSLEGIRAAIEIEPEVIRVIHLDTPRLGPEELLVAAKVDLLHDLSLIEVAAVSKRIENNIQSNVAQIRAVYLEPDVDESHRDSGSFVGDTVGHIDRHDPDYHRLTGQVEAVDPSRPPVEEMTADELDDDIWS